jgi:hypothetical protein
MLRLRLMVHSRVFSASKWMCLMASPLKLAFELEEVHVKNGSVRKVPIRRISFSLSTQVVSLALLGRSVKMVVPGPVANIPHPQDLAQRRIKRANTVRLLRVVRCIQPERSEEL